MDGGRAPRGTFKPVALTDRRPPIERWLVVAGMVLVIVVVKPWQAAEPAAGGAAAGTGRGGASRVSDHPVPSPSSTDSPANLAVAAFCLRPGSWLVASVERWRDQRIRVWRALVPASSARGPDDPSIPIVPVVSEGLTVLGWCAPVSGPDSPTAPVEVSVWLRGADGAAPITVDSSRPAADRSANGELYRPPGRGPSSRAASWSAGTYVFRYREHDGRERWFAIAVEIRARLSPAP